VEVQQLQAVQELILAQAVNNRHDLAGLEAKLGLVA
jgi:hypothetical protein